MEKMTIGQLAKRAHVNQETIRYYERRGLIAVPPRNKSGHRQFSFDALNRTKFIKRTQALGFSLKEIEEFLSLRVAPGRTSRDVKAKVEFKIADIEQKISDLELIRNALLRLLGKCVGKGPVSLCPILEELDR